MVYVFGDCILDTRIYTLHHAGILIPLGPKAFSVLVYLLQHRNRVVSKQELSNLLWPDQYVSHTTLARCIASLRKAVDDTREEQRIIQTLYGRGYRFIAPVHERPCESPADIAPTESLASLLPNSQAFDSTDALPGFFTPTQDQEASLQCLPGSLPAQDGEPWEVTILCGALAHMEVLAARLAPEALHRLVCKFFTHAQREVQCGGGIIQAFLDNSFLALFGVLEPRERNAQQAVQAAERLRRCLHTQDAAISKLGGEMVKVRLGMHTGTVVGRRIGHDRQLTYIAVGDTIRMAMRLQQLAEPDTLLLSGATARRVQGAMRVTACGPVLVALGEQQAQRMRPAHTVHGLRP